MTGDPLEDGAAEGALEAAAKRLERAVALLEGRVRALKTDAVASAGGLFEEDRANLAAELDAEAVGKVHDVLFESVSRRRATQVSGRTGSGRMVSADGGAELIGQIRPVRIVRAMANTLAGEIISGAGE